MPHSDLPQCRPTDAVTDQPIAAVPYKQRASRRRLSLCTLSSWSCIRWHHKSVECLGSLNYDWSEGRYCIPTLLIMDINQLVRLSSVSSDGVISPEQSRAPAAIFSTLPIVFSCIFESIDFLSWWSVFVLFFFTTKPLWYSFLITPFQIVNGCNMVPVVSDSSEMKAAMDILHFWREVYSTYFSSVLPVLSLAYLCLCRGDWTAHLETFVCHNISVWGKTLWCRQW